MNIELLIQDSIKGMIYNVSDLAQKITWDTSFESDQPGSLSFNMLEDKKVSISHGSIVSLKVNGQGVFFGYLFKYGKSSDGVMEITAYDQLRYLKNKDTYVFGSATASQIFSKLCIDQKLKYRVVNASPYSLAPRICDNKTLYEMIQEAIDETLTGTTQWYTIRDNFGTLEFAHLNSYKTSLAIGDQSLLQDFDFESSIDDDTYNQVKLVRENEGTKKRELYVIKDSNTIFRWGLLQYFETVDKNSNPAQIKAKAEMILKLKNRATKTLSLPCIGDLRVFAGCGIVLSIQDLVTDGIAKDTYFIVTSCSHTFANNMHTMDLEVMVTI